MSKMDMEGKQIRFGIVGSSCTGKTCIVKRFVENSFQGSTYNLTPGVEFFSRRMSIKPLGSATIIILDIGGNAINSKMLKIYLHGIDVFLLTYDMTNANSLNELRNWIDILSKKDIKYDASLALVGAKGDLEHLRTVRLDAHTSFTQEFNIPLSFLISSKSGGESVVQCFSKCAVYHLSPDSKTKIRDHAIIQNTFKRPSISGSAGQSHSSNTENPGTSDTTSKIKSQSSGGSKSKKDPKDPNDPNSTVCNIQ